MNNIITLSQLITRLAKATGSDPNTARRFLKAFFATVEDRLAAGESVTIKNIGTFRPASSDPLEKSEEVVFIPDAIVMDEVNRPFEMFEAVELAPGVEFDKEEEPENTADMAEDIVEEQEAAPVAPTEESQPEATETSDVVSTTDNVPVEEFEPQTVEETIIHAPAPAPATAPAPVQAPAPVSEPVREEPAEDDYEEEPRQPRKKRSLLWLWICLAVLAACVGGYFAAVHSEPIPDLYGDEEEIAADSLATDSVQMTITEVDINTSEPVKTDKPKEPEAQKPAAAAPVAQATPAIPAPASKEKVYDTVDVSLIDRKSVV